MSQPLFDQYKEALRRGHVAAARGKFEDAASAYRAASELAPDRALACIGLGDALRRLGRLDAALEAYGLALRRSPQEETALRGRSTTLGLQRRPIEAARDLETLTEMLERGERIPEACEAACDALEFAESRSRRRAVERLVLRLNTLPDDDATRHARTRAHGLFEPPPVARSLTSEAATPAGTPDRSIRSQTPPFDRVAARTEAEGHLVAGRLAEAKPLLLAVAAAERGAGELDAALDACLALVQIDPADQATQLELAANQLARGWTSFALEKVRLLDRLAGFTDDGSARAIIVTFARDHRIQAALAE